MSRLSEHDERVAHAAPAPTAPRRPLVAHRVIALDALRGSAIVMFILVNTAGIRSALPYHLDHAEWHGLTFADTFFPVFLFSMGAAMGFSSRAQRAATVARRVVLLLVLGIGLGWLRTGAPQPTGVLQKIAVAYLAAWLVLLLPRRLHATIAVALLGATWAAFDWGSAGAATGSWDQGTNFAAALDTLVLGRPATEGFATALFATANVLGGVLVLRSVRGLDPRRALWRLAAWAALSVAAGLALSVLVPVNKRIWTPSFTVLTHGIACLYLVVLWWVAEVRRSPRTVRPLVALGRNPISIYVLFTAAHVLLVGVRIPAMDALAGPLGPMAASLVWSGVFTLLAVGLAEWLDKRRIYMRV